jgi:hypothetical protein
MFAPNQESNMAELERDRAKLAKSDVANRMADSGPVPAVGTTELLNLRGEEERLKMACDIEQLRAQLAALREPRQAWWRRGAIVTTLTGIIAAVVPVTTAVQAHYQKERELALQASKQDHEIRTSYLDRLDKPGAKMRTLRFVVATTTDPALIAWARAEMAQVQAELDEIDRKIADLEKQKLAAAAEPAPTSKKGASPADDARRKAEIERQRELDHLKEVRQNAPADRGLGKRRQLDDLDDGNAAQQTRAAATAPVSPDDPPALPVTH